MAVGAIVSALKEVGVWVAENPGFALGAVDMVAKLNLGKKPANYDEMLQIADEKINQLGAAALELEEKIDNEVEQLHSELKNVQQQMQTMKKMLCVMGAVLGAAIIAIVLLAIF